MHSQTGSQVSQRVSTVRPGWEAAPVPQAPVVGPPNVLDVQPPAVPSRTVEPPDALSPAAQPPDVPRVRGVARPVVPFPDVHESLPQLCSLSSRSRRWVMRSVSSR